MDDFCFVFTIKYYCNHYYLFWAFFFLGWFLSWFCLAFFWVVFPLSLSYPLFTKQQRVQRVMRFRACNPYPPLRT